MTELTSQTSKTSPTPLDTNEIMSLVGAVVIGAGVFYPALMVEWSRTFIEYGNIVSAVILGLASAIVWSVFKRRVDPVMPLPSVCFTVIAVYGLCAWLDVLLEPPQATQGTSTPFSAGPKHRIL